MVLYDYRFVIGGKCEELYFKINIKFDWGYKMREIPLYNTFKKINPINKGMSGDKKYYIEDEDGKHFLLRIVESSEYEQKKAEFELIKNMNSLDVPMPFPIDFGLCDDGKSVYTLPSWVEGEEVETTLSKLIDKEHFVLKGYRSKAMK